MVLVWISWRAFSSKSPRTTWRLMVTYRQRASERWNKRFSVIIFQSFLRKRKMIWTTSNYLKFYIKENLNIFIFKIIWKTPYNYFDIFEQDKWGAFEETENYWYSYLTFIYNLTFLLETIELNLIFLSCKRDKHENNLNEKKLRNLIFFTRNKT